MSGDDDKDDATDALRGALSAQLAAIARAHRLGVKLFAGTDAPNPACFFGSSLHWEPARFVEAGLSTIEVLRLATQDAAAAVGAEDLGSIAPGKLADTFYRRKFVRHANYPPIQNFVMTPTGNTFL